VEVGLKVGSIVNSHLLSAELGGGLLQLDSTDEDVV